MSVLWSFFGGVIILVSHGKVSQILWFDRERKGAAPRLSLCALRSIMDALFVPLAAAVGASVDQIKVSNTVKAIANCSDQPVTAHFMPTHCVPAW
jgi:hypothetical protein